MGLILRKAAVRWEKSQKRIKWASSVVIKFKRGRDAIGRYTNKIHSLVRDQT